MIRKKVLAILVFFILIVAGIVLYIYQSTDYLKTNQQLFWKYAVKNGEISHMFNSDTIKNIKQKKENNSYTQKSELSISRNNNTFTAISDTKAKNENDTFSYVQLQNNSEDMLDFNLVKKGEVVGLKMDGLADGYIMVKNSDLKELAKNFGIKDVSWVPDSINMSNLSELLEISDKDKLYILKKYRKLILADIKRENYSKEKEICIEVGDQSHTVTAYSIYLTEDESKKLLSDFFYELSNDSRSLDILSSKLKLLNLPSEQTDTNVLSKKFLEMSEDIDAMDIEYPDDEFIEITVYVENSELLQTTIKIKDEKIINVVYDRANSNLNIKQELICEDNRLALSIPTIINKIINQIQEINISTDVLEDESELTTHVDIVCNYQINISYNTNTKITNDIELSSDYDDSAKIILNNLTEQELKKFSDVIIQNAKKIYNSKISKLSRINKQN